MKLPILINERIGCLNFLVFVLAVAAADTPDRYGRVSPTEYILTPKQIHDFHEDGCCTLEDVLTEEEVAGIEGVFDKFLRREIEVPGKDFCDMSKPFSTPFEEWSIVNCMLPTRYYPPFQNNIYEQLTESIARQLHPNLKMTKDYDQFLNKRPGKTDAVFSWHQDMGYWPSAKVLGIEDESLLRTCTFSLAIDDSMKENGCLAYVPGSHKDKTLRPHKPLNDSREEGHALTIDVTGEKIVLAPAKRGSVTIHNEYVVHGSGGNTLPNKQRRTYVLAYRSREVVDAERKIGFTHSHNDEVNWDTFEELVASDEL